MQASTPSPDNPSPVAAPAIGMALASLVLGILGVVLSPLLIGACLGVIGLFLGIAQLRKHPYGRKMAGWGTGLSIVGMIAGLAFGALYYHAYSSYKEAMADIQNDDSETLQSWEGREVPDFRVKTLEGRSIQISELRGKRVVLDFWATWCPPCVKEIPHFMRLHQQTSRDDLEIVGISEEDTSTLAKFVKEQGIKYPIASSAGETLPSPFDNISSIPTTFFLDRKGIIQSIAVGYHDFDSIKSFALAKDSTNQPKPAPTAPPSELKQAATQLNLREIWNQTIPQASLVTAGDWDGDQGDEVLVLAGDKVHILSSDGSPLSKISLPQAFSFIECGRHATEGLRLLGHQHWGRETVAMDKSGKQIWTVSFSLGINGAHWGDLDGDGTDEMIAGGNGSGGLHAISSEGKSLWKVTKIGNVWSQAVVPAGQDRPARVMATEAGGTVRVYDAQGKLLKTITPEGRYCSEMTARVVNGSGRTQVMVNGQKRVIATDEQGNIDWSTPVEDDSLRLRSPSFVGGDLTGDGDIEWLLRRDKNNLLVVNWKGEQLATMALEKKFASAVVARSGSGPGLLVILAGTSVSAFRVESTQQAAAE